MPARSGRASRRGRSARDAGMPRGGGAFRRPPRAERWPSPRVVVGGDRHLNAAGGEPRERVPYPRLAGGVVGRRDRHLEPGTGARPQRILPDGLDRVRGQPPDAVERAGGRTLRDGDARRDAGRRMARRLGLVPLAYEVDDRLDQITVSPYLLDGALG